MEKIKQAAKKHITTIRSTSSKFKSEVRRNILKAVLSAFGFVIALVWRDAIRSGVDEIMTRIGMEGTGYVLQITTALIMTAICIVGIMVASRVKGKEDVKE